MLVCVCMGGGSKIAAPSSSPLPIPQLMSIVIHQRRLCAGLPVLPCLTLPAPLLTRGVVGLSVLAHALALPLDLDTVPLIVALLVAAVLAGELARGLGAHALLVLVLAVLGTDVAHAVLRAHASTLSQKMQLIR